MKCDQNTVTLIGLRIVYGCFHVQLQSWEVATETVWPAKPKIFTAFIVFVICVLPLQKRSADLVSLFPHPHPSHSAELWHPHSLELSMYQSHPGTLWYFLVLNSPTQKILIKKTVNYSRGRRILLISLLFSIWYITYTPVALRYRISLLGTRL